MPPSLSPAVEFAGFHHPAVSLSRRLDDPSNRQDQHIFALVQLSTRGGPDRRSETLLTYLYEQAFKNYEFGYATSIAVANFVIAMVLAGILAFLFRKNPMEARR